MGECLVKNSSNTAFSDHTASIFVNLDFFRHCPRNDFVACTDPGPLLSFLVSSFQTRANDPMKVGGGLFSPQWGISKSRITTLSHFATLQLATLRSVGLRKFRFETEEDARKTTDVLATPFPLLVSELYNISTSNESLSPVFQNEHYLFFVDAQRSEQIVRSGAPSDIYLLIAGSKRTP